MKRSEMNNLKKWVDYLLPLVKFNPCLPDNPTPEEIAWCERIEPGCTQGIVSKKPFRDDVDLQALLHDVGEAPTGKEGQRILDKARVEEYVGLTPLEDES